MDRPLVVIGGGIVGLATAHAVLRREPGRPLLLLEKEAEVARHQTGHNSGVIHSGVYYRPGSLKARLCVEGRARLLVFAREHDIPVRLCGKLIVATSSGELDRLAELRRRAQANGVPEVRALDRAGVRGIEPEAAGIAGLSVPGTGIIDYRRVARALAEEIARRGGQLRFRSPVLGVEGSGSALVVELPGERIEASFVVNAAGLQCDEVARRAGIVPPARIVPFRGEYYRLRSDRRGLARGLIYPVPDPDLPFLGVHITPTIDGEVEAGPNAILAGSREGYRKTDIDLGELAGTLLYPGLPRLARRFWRTSIHEANRSLRKSVFVRDLQRLLPALSAEDLVPGGAGVRAQALRPNGELVDDFLLEERPGALHVLNAPSPAATSSLAIGEYLAARIPNAAT
jgi:L-2-hydroxyglutarate oxidase